MDNKFLGREESIGFGIQSTTASVAPQIYTRHLKNGMRRVVNKKKNVSAMGRPEMHNGSAVMSSYHEGPVEFKLQDISIGYLLYAWSGGVTTSANADASGLVKNHSFPVVSGVERLLTMSQVNRVANRRIKNIGVSMIEFSSEASSEGDYVKVAADLVGGDRETATDVPAYVAETEFTQEHVTAKIATSLAGLTAAPVLETTNIKLTLSRAKTPFIPHGTRSSVSNDSEPVMVTGEVTLRYKATDLETNWENNDALAFEVNFENTSKVIGTSARSKLNFRMPQVTFESWDRTDDLDSYVEQTVSFDAELNTAAGYELATVLTNLKTSYTA